MPQPFLNVVIDLSHHNGQVDFQRVAAAGIIGVIYKSTHGMTGTDVTHNDRRTAAKNNGLLWGSYHFGTGVGDGRSQAQRFLQVTDAGPNDLLALDLERNADGDGNPLGPDMTMEQARDFVRYVHDQTNKWPMLYCGEYVKEALNGQPDPVLGNCPLWLAQYTTNGGLPSWNPSWKTWTLWQYTGDGKGEPPHSVDGVGVCERDYFIGAEAHLREFWSSNLSFTLPKDQASAVAIPQRG